MQTVSRLPSLLLAMDVSAFGTKTAVHTPTVTGSNRCKAVLKKLGGTHAKRQTQAIKQQGRRRHQVHPIRPEIPTLSN